MLRIAVNGPPIKCRRPDASASRFFLYILSILILALSSEVASNGSQFLFSKGAEAFTEAQLSTEWLNAEIPNQIMESYNKGAFRNCIIHLQSLINLHLPDGRRDTYLFLLAECQSKLKLHQFAQIHLQEILDKYPGSPHHAKALFRLAQIQYIDNKDTLLTEIFQTIRKRFPNDPLTDATAFLLAKHHMENQRYSEVIQCVKIIKENSPYFQAGLFLSALALNWQGKSEAALVVLTSLLKSASSKHIRDECHLVIGHIYAKLKQYDNARKNFDKVPKNSPRTVLAKLKTAMTYMNEENHREAIKISRPLLAHEKYHFEAALVLLTSYWESKDTSRAFAVRRYLSNYGRLMQIIIKIEEEKLMLDDLNRQFQTLLLHPNRNRLSINKDAFPLQIKKLKNKHLALLSKLKKEQSITGHINSRNILENRLLKHFEADMTTLKVRYTSVVNQINRDNKVLTDTLIHKKAADLAYEQEQLRELVTRLQQHITKTTEHNESDAALVQPKLVDVGFLMYQRLKSRYHLINEQIRALTKKRDEFVRLKAAEDTK